MASNNGGVNPTTDIQEIERLLPKRLIESNRQERTFLNIVKNFHPREEEYKAAGFKEDQIEAKRQTCEILIPEHQRFFVWTDEQQHKLIDSIFKNFTIPDVMVSKSREERGVVYQEDGQQRFTTLWRFYNNQFPLKYGKASIYYNKDVSDMSDTYSLQHHFPEYKNRLDSYKFYITEVEFNAEKDDVTAEYFERLNSGKSLNDGDKLWNRRNSPLVKVALEIAEDVRIKEDLKKILGINLNIIAKSSRTRMCSLVGLVAALSKPFEEGQIETWGDNVLTESYAKLYQILDISVNKEFCIKCIKILLKCYKNCSNKGSKALSNNTHTTNRAFTRHFGVMIYDLRLSIAWAQNNPALESSEIFEWLEKHFCDYWAKIIVLIRSDPYKFKDPQHFINEMFIGDDLPNRNSKIGKRVISRHTALIAAALKKEIEYYH
jgi:hypothetical protein